MDSFLNPIRIAVKKVMHKVAVALDALTGGRLSPNAVTIIGLLAHIPIVWLIVQGSFITAGLWLIVFGLFDALDGELARLQKRASPAGMFLDSVTDRIKEIMVYVGISTYLMATVSRGACNFLDCFSRLDVPQIAPHHVIGIIIAIMGGSILTSYINAWGEAVMSRAGVKRTEMNKAFRGGLGSFEVRMALLAFGLLTGWLWFALCLIGILVALTIIDRLFRVFRELGRVQD